MCPNMLVSFHSATIYWLLQLQQYYYRYIANCITVPQVYLKWAWEEFQTVNENCLFTTGCIPMVVTQFGDITRAVLVLLNDGANSIYRGVLFQITQTHEKKKGNGWHVLSLGNALTTFTYSQIDNFHILVLLQQKRTVSHEMISARRYYIAPSMAA